MGASQVDFWGNFWPSFLGNLGADFIVSVLLLVALPRWLDRARRAKLDLVASVVDFAPSAMVLFYLRNIGKVDFRADEVYWHVFLEQDRFEYRDIKDNDQNPMRTYKHHMINGKPYVNFEGQAKVPIFPGRSMALFNVMISSTLSEHVTADKLKDGAPIYSLSTIRGVYPRPRSPFRKMVARLRKQAILEDGHDGVAFVVGGSWNLKLM